MRLLILGGTTEAGLLAHRIAGLPGIEPTLSLAGRTRHPAASPIPLRIGGVAGLRAFLTANRIDAVVDATHPFAAQMSANAVAACSGCAVPLARFTRPPWQPVVADRWTTVIDMAQAVQALGTRPRRVFLTVGGLQLAAFATAPWHHYLVRAIDPPEAVGRLPDHRLVLARGPFDAVAEARLMRAANIDVLVTKNSGGAATEAKLVAARALDIEVVMVEQPEPPAVFRLESVEAVVSWIRHHRSPLNGSA